MKAIEKRYVATCKKCDTTIEYEEKDVFSEEYESITGFDMHKDVIKCISCENLIWVEDRNAQ